MPYDPLLADRLRYLVSAIPGVTEQFKFGGPSFMVNDVVFIRAHHNGHLMQRCKPERTDELLKLPGVQRLVMKGKTDMKGWLIVDSSVVDSDAALQFWIDVAYEAAMVAKPAKKKSKK